MTPASVRPRLRTRLIAWYAGSLCLVLLASAGAVRFAVGRALERAHAESMTSSAQLFRQFFRVEIAEYRSVEATLAHIAGELVFDDRAIDVHRPDGELFVPPGVLAAHQYPRLRAPVRDITVPLDPELAPGWTIEVHASAATLVAASRRIDYWLLGGIPVIVCIAALLGWWLAGRALRPIGRMAAEARLLDATGGSRLTLHDPADELGRFGASFNSLLDRLDAALTQQRRFLSDAAHELRTPLARLRSRVELGQLALTQSADADAKANASVTLRSLQGELHAATEVVGALLALARAEAGEAAASMQQGFVDDVITDELPRWRESAAQAGITITLGAFDEVVACFDATLLRRLLGLLLDNAIHYSPTGSIVLVQLTQEGHEVSLIVEDHGIGIAEHEREAVFNRFHRSASARLHRADGSGLGLALARWIVQQHGGAIRATSRRDGLAGTAIVATWPVRPPGSQSARAIAKPSAPVSAPTTPAVRSATARSSTGPTPQTEPADAPFRSVHS